jgi:hypothetical protein
MIQQAKKRIKSSIKAGFSLIEVSFVMLLVGAVIIPIVLNQNAQSKLDNLQLQSLENINLNDTELVALLANPAKKVELVEEVTDVMMDLARGAKIVDNNVTSKEALHDPLATTQGNYLNTLTTFFNDTGVSGKYKYKYKLPIDPDQMIPTAQKTFFLETSNGKFVPVFTYKWEFRDQSSNNNDENQTTSAGTYLVRAELKIYNIPSPVAQSSPTTVPIATAPKNKSTTFNIRNEVLVEDIKTKIPRVLINFTFDMSRGACYSPATSQYSRRLTRGSANTAKLNYISYNSGKGLLCAPYFAPSTNNSPSSSPWDDGNVFDGAVLKATWYDIYYNKQNPGGQLFWTNGAGADTNKETSQTVPGTAMGHAAFRTSGTTFKYAEEVPDPDPILPPAYSSMPSSGSYTLRIPKLTMEATRNFPDGDFDKNALNYIRCMSYAFTFSGGAGKNTWGAKKSSNYWASDFYGPNATNLSSGWMQRNCYNYNSGWYTPANRDSIDIYDTTEPSLLTPTMWSSTKQLAFSRFFVRQNAGNFGGDTFVNLEAARMAISSNVNDIGDPSAEFWAEGAARDMETVWSSDDESPEENRWISGVEFQRSAALMTIFKLLSQVPENREKFEVSVMLNNPTEDTNISDGTTYKEYPHDSGGSLADKLTKGTIGDTDQDQFQDVMKHLYGMNRLLGSGSPPSGFGPPFSNAGSANYRHLANKNYFDVKQSIEDFRNMLKETAQLKCQQDKGLTLSLTPVPSPCNAAATWKKHLGYDHYFNVIYFPSDMSGDSTVVNPAKNNGTGVLGTEASFPFINRNTELINNLKVNMIKDDIAGTFAPSGDPFRGKITYVLVVHNDTYSHLYTRVQWLMNQMKAKGVPVVLETVEDPEDYETFLNTELLTLFEAKTEGGTAGWSDFNNMKPDDYAY